MLTNDKQDLYFIAIIPNKEVVDDITQVKKAFSDMYGPNHALKTVPHITLMSPFKEYPQREPILLSFLQDFAYSNGTTFEVTLKGFNQFRHRVLYIDVLQNDVLSKLQHFLVLELNRKIGVKTQSQRFHPHITISHRDLTPSIFKNSWSSYKEMTFEARFTVNSISLLHHNGQHWEIKANFTF